MKRTPLKRHKPLRASQEARTSAPAIRPRRCDARKGGCGEMFTPARQMQKACGPRCASLMVEHLKARTAEKAAREDRRKTRAELEALKTIPQLKKEAQREFNRFIRARDRRAGVDCICCGQPLEWDRLGGCVDAGHWRSTGAADHLRFDERNCHAQRSDCNRYGAGRAVEYRAGLIQRLGLSVVEDLETNNTPIKWTREGLRAIRDEYRRKANELEKQ